MKFEVAECKDGSGDWLVSHIHDDGDGEMYNAYFSGPRAEPRAREYAEFVSQKYAARRPSWLLPRR